MATSNKLPSNKGRALTDAAMWRALQKLETRIGDLETVATGCDTTFSGGLILAGDVLNYEPTNDASPKFCMGSSATEALCIQAVYDSGAQTLNYALFETKTASATADKGKMLFNVDESQIFEINDSGIDITGSIVVSGTVDGRDVATDGTTLDTLDSVASKISTDTAAPSTAPSKVGDIFVDTASATAYVATGTSSSSDWEQIDGGSGNTTTIQVDGVDVSVSSPTLDFDGTDFTLAESPDDTFDITINAERIQDIVGAMTTGNTETLITVTYQDADGTIDFVVDEASIDHDALTNYVANEHIDWTSTTDNFSTSGTLSANYVSVSNTSSPSHAEKTLFYDNTNKCFAYYNDESEVTHQIGQEAWIRVYNNSGATITNGSAVYVTGQEGVEDRLTIGLAKADAISTSRILGVSTHDIENNTFGYITQFGDVNSLNLSAFSNGDPVWLSADTAGALTGTEPESPNTSVFIGYVNSNNATTGRLFVTAIGNTGSTPAGQATELTLPVRKGSVGTITKGAPVYISGYNVGQSVVEVEEADADGSGTMPAIGLANDSITNSANSTVLISGRLTGVDTSAYTAGDALYVSTTAGTLTSTKPVGSAKIQKVGIVARSNVSNGIIEVIGAGRSNDVPNFTAADKFWYGGTSGVTTEGDITSAGRALLDDADASAQRTTLGLGSAALSASTDFVSTTEGSTINGSADEVQLIVQGHSTQTSNIFEVETSAASNLFTVDNSGNVTVAGTVDGRDIATDGTKLDGIEALADVTDETNVKAALDGATITGAVLAAADKLLFQDSDASDALRVETFSDLEAALSLGASQITSGTLTHERGGLEADISAYDGLIRVSSGATSQLKSQFSGTAAPTATDDSAAGYAVGSRWIDTTNDKEYVCLDSTATAAVWTETTGAAGAGDLWSDPVDSDIVPSTDSTYDLGSHTARFAQAHVDTIMVQDTGGISTSNGTNAYTQLKFNQAHTADLDYFEMTHGESGTATPTLSVAGTSSHCSMNFQAKGLGGYGFLGTSAHSAVIGLYEDTDNGTNYIGLKAPSAVTANCTFILPDGDGSAGQVLTTDGAKNLSFTSPAGSGDVTGPASATDNAIARFDTTTGKLLQNSSVTMDDNGFILFPTTIGIKDDSDKRQLIFTSTAAASQYFNMTNALTGGPTLSVAGTATDIDCNIAAKGAGNINLGNFTFDADATIGVGQDNYILTYDSAAGTWGPEAAPTSGTTEGKVIALNMIL